MLRAAVQRHLAAEHGRWSVPRVVVAEGADPAETRPKGSEARAGSPGILVVAAAHAQRDPVALRDDEAGRPDLDVELVDLSRRERLRLVVRVIGPVRHRKRRVELAVRGAQPTLSDGSVGIERALEGYFAQVGAEDAQDEEEVRVRGAGGDEELRRDGTGDLGLGRERRSQERDAIAQRFVDDATFARARLR